MYKIRKTFEVAGAHHLDLTYSSPCERAHGHNWIITVELSRSELNFNGMVIDFKTLKTILMDNIHAKLDHRELNEMFEFNPTAENIAKWVLETVNDYLEGPQCTRVEVQESRDNVAIYEVPFNA